MNQENKPTQDNQPTKTYDETAPPLSDYSPWKVGQPDDGIVWLYKSSVDGKWRIIKDEDHALQEATGCPVEELCEYEQVGDYESSERGELRAIFVPPTEPDTDSMTDSVSESKEQSELLTKDKNGTTGEVVEKIKNSRLDIIVHPENDEDVIIKEGDDIITTDRSGARRLSKEIREKLVEGQPLFRHASVVRLTMDDPTNENRTKGTILIKAGPCKDGVGYSTYCEEDEKYVDVSCEVLKRFKSDTVMTKRDIKSWAKAKANTSDISLN